MCLVRFYGNVGYNAGENIFNLSAVHIRPAEVSKCSGADTEGIERVSDKETMRFLDISRASAAEVQTQIYIGIKIAYIDKTQGERWVAELDEISKMITGLIKNIKRNPQD